MAAVDVILKTLMCSREFRESNDKNWDAVAKLIPGSTPKQCSIRWNELQSVMPVQGMGLVLTHNTRQVLSKLLNCNLIGNDESKASPSTNKKIEDLSHSYHEEFTKSLKEGNNKGLTTEEVNRSSSRDGNNTDQKIHEIHSKHSALSFKSGRGSSLSQGPNMVIHVCDESKNLKQDFTCPRDLLIKEMQYFAEYLSVEAQRWEEVDISVHCDVQIFDWLMKYVKRGLTDKDEAHPKLEPNNVISILISSDFLKMDSLVYESYLELLFLDCHYDANRDCKISSWNGLGFLQVTECIEYCHKNMSAIVATPCNMNCINDKLVTRISDLFNHNELDDIKDRKDKFKSKLYCKKIEDLFGPDKLTLFSPANGSTLYRCTACKKLLTADSEKKLRCVPNRMMIDYRGQVLYSHIRDNGWNVNDYVQGLREKLKSWKEVYWRLWGSINILYCYRCGEYFQCSELGHCRYHPASVVYNQTDVSVVGIYPCCQQKVLRFDTTGQHAGCSYRDHRVSRNTPLSTSIHKEKEISEGKAAVPASDKENSADADRKKAPEDCLSNRKPSLDIGVGSRGTDQSKEVVARVVNNPIVVDDLHSHRNVVEVPFQRLMSARACELDIFGVEEDVLMKKSRAVEQEKSSVLPDSIDPSDKKTASEPQHLPPIRRSRSRVLQRVAMRRLSQQNKEEADHDHGEDEDQPESEDTEPEIKGPVKTRPTRKVTSASRKDFSTFKSYKWDLMRSSRWNQDAQREEDQKRMTELVAYLTKQRQANLTPENNEKDKQKPKEYIGGLYSKIEHQFRLSQQVIANKTQAGSSTVSLTGQRNRKIPPKSC